MNKFFGLGHKYRSRHIFEIIKVSLYFLTHLGPDDIGLGFGRVLLFEVSGSIPSGANLDELV